MKPTLSMRWRRVFALPKMTRSAVAGIFTLGSVTGMLLMHCTSPPQPQTAFECQSLVWIDFVSSHDGIFDGGHLTNELARQLIRDVRRCSGRDTTFETDILTTDPFGIGGQPSAGEPDAGAIFRSRL